MLENIRRLCAERGISLARLERETGIANGVIARWDTSSPRVESLVKVADFFGVTVDELLKDESNERPA